ncbi:MAG TPA: sortase [Acidimicrobiales bacterium]|nr:sortase [Acidimicrobiales bacterium]
MPPRAEDRVPEEPSGVDSTTGRFPAPPAELVTPSAPVAAAVADENSVNPMVVGVVPRTGSWRRIVLLVVVLIVLGILAFVGFERYVTASREHRSQRQLDSAAQAAFAPGGGATVATHAVFATIEVPRVGIHNLAIQQGATLAHLRQGPALDVASWSSAVGTMVVVGHRRTYGQPFARVSDLRTGDVIWLQTALGRRAYRVVHDPVTANAGDTFTPARSWPSPLLVLETSDDLLANRVTAVAASPLDQLAGRAVPSTSSAIPKVPFVAVPGDRGGVVALTGWAVVLALIIVAAFRPMKTLAAVPVKVVLWLAVGLVFYQMLLGFDRVLPGTS